MHYFIASIILVLVVPLPNFASIGNVKYVFYQVSILLFQIALCLSVGRTGLHNMVVSGLTILYQTENTKLWFDINFKPICIWDAWFHVLLPGLLISTLGYFQLLDQYQREC